MFVPIELKHRDQLDRTLVTHVRLLRRRANTSAAQKCLEHIGRSADKNGIAAIDQFLPGWPPERKELGAENDMWHCLRHYANAPTSGTQHENKGLIEVGYLDDKPDLAAQQSQSLQIDQKLQSLLHNAANIRGTGGEGEGHRMLKLKVASNPQWLGIDWKHTVEIESRLPSGDAIDVVFRGEQIDVAVEVKPANDAKADLVRGVFQCVKYRAVLEAEAKVQHRERQRRVVLALGSPVPVDVLALLKQLQIEYVDDLSSKD